MYNRGNIILFFLEVFIIEIYPLILKNANSWNNKTSAYEKTDFLLKEGIVIRKGPILSADTLSKVCDLEGKYLYPSFTDSHAHIMGTGFLISSPSLKEVSSEKELSELILSSKLNDIDLRGWDEEILGFIPERSYLDSLFTDRSVILTRKCGHAAVVNSFAVEKYQLDKFEGVDSSDVKKGYLKERAAGKLRENLKIGFEAYSAYFEAGCEAFLKQGITSVHSDDFHSVQKEVFEKTLEKNNKIRLYEKLCCKNLSDLEKKFSEGLFKKLSGFSEIRCIKIFLDGSFGARTAFLLENYEKSDYKGILYMSTEEFKSIIDFAERNNISTAVHVIGDGALEAALQAYSGIQNQNPLRHRLIHLQMASEDQLKKIKNLNLYVSIQPVFYDSDMKFVPGIIGQKRFTDTAYPFRKLLEKEINFSISTDSPVEKIDPFKNLSSSLRFMNIKEAFYHYSYSGAQAAFYENRLGLLEEGYFADGFVLDKDLFQMNESELKKATPKMVIFNGEIILP